MGRLNGRKTYLVGRATIEIRRSIAKATKGGDLDEVTRLRAYLRNVQDTCPHPEVDHRNNRSISVAPNIRYKKGDHVVWCFRCGKILEHNGESVVNELPLSAWERILDDSLFE